LRNEVVGQLARDHRLTTIAERFLGKPVIPHKAILFDKCAHANWLVPWHQDRVLPLRQKFTDPEWGPWTQKHGVDFAHAPTWAMNRIVGLRVHLDDSTEHNGPLRVILGSHSFGVLSQAEVVEKAKDGTVVTATVQRGGVIAMRPLLIHASSKSSTRDPRRVLHIEYTDDMKLGENIELALS
jgi:ectoine hydroxylase-related dioxygenase (phytanoyl-CoA dioxygenase family)